MIEWRAMMGIDAAGVLMAVLGVGTVAVGLILVVLLWNLVRYLRERR